MSNNGEKVIYECVIRGQPGSEKRTLQTSQQQIQIKTNTHSKMQVTYTIQQTNKKAPRQQTNKQTNNQINNTQINVNISSGIKKYLHSRNIPENQLIQLLVLFQNDAKYPLFVIAIGKYKVC